MCGIAGSEDPELLDTLAKSLEHRGSSTNIDLDSGMAHILHSVVGDVSQPLRGKKGVLVANCEIYNWKQLEARHNIDARNDADLLLQLIETKGFETALEMVDGVYAIAYRNGDKIMLARDILGVKPLWYSKDPFAFASERQAFSPEETCRELHPRQIAFYDLETGEFNRKDRSFFEVDVNEDMTFEDAVQGVKTRLKDAVEKRIPAQSFGIMLSGGVDSSTISQIAADFTDDFVLYGAGTQPGNTDPPRDTENARFMAERLDKNFNYNEVTLDEIESALPELANWISTTSTVKLGVALPVHFSLQGDEKVVMSGLGSEQLFAGYHRHQRNLNNECISGLRQLWHQDLYRDDVVSMRNGYELRLPFLDHELVRFSLTIPEEHKRGEELRKKVLRYAASELGVPDRIAFRKKVAAQYGSNFDKAIDRLARNSDFDSKQAFLNSLREQPDLKLAALSSGGKDSNAAIYRMKRRNYEIDPVINIQAEGEHPMLFDKKESEVVKRQAEEMNSEFVLMTQKKDEKEFDVLQRSLNKVRQEYGVDGVVAGALFSDYQRQRVEKAAEDAGLKVYTPLWAENPERYIRWLIREGFKIRVSEVKGRGLEDSWEGRILDRDSVDELIELSEKYGFNAAGEGGSYETVVEKTPLDQF